MKKLLFLIILLVIIIIFVNKFIFIGFRSEGDNNINDINTTEQTTANNLSEGFYIKKGNRFERIYNSGGYLNYGEYLIVANKCYYEDIEMNANDELVYVNDEEEIRQASISYYEDLNFSTIGVPFKLNHDNEFLYFGDTIGNAKFAMDRYSKVLSIDEEPIKTRIEHDHFVNGLVADKECIVSCLKGTQIEKIKVTADCHILKNVNEDFLKNNGCIAKTNWDLSSDGYVSLNKDFTDVYYDMPTFSRDGYYMINASVRGYHSNRLTSVLVKYKQ